MASSLMHASGGVHVPDGGRTSGEAGSGISENGLDGGRQGTQVCIRPSGIAPACGAVVAC